MLNLRNYLLLTILFVPFVSWAQLASTLQTAQTQGAPCTAGSGNSGAPGSKSGSSLLAKWKKQLDDKSNKIAQQIGVPLPTSDDLKQVAGARRVPCPPKAVASGPAPTAPQAATLKLPPDSSVTLHCNPMTPPSKDGAHQTTLTLPDPHDYAVPKASDFEADGVVPDLAAKTPCYLIKVDPKTNKSFVQQ